MELEKILKESPVPCLVDFYADWCGPCHAMNPVIEAIKQEFDGILKIIKVDIDESPDAASYYNIHSIPTFIFFRYGNEIWRIIGANPSLLIKKLKESFIERPPA